MTWAVKIEHYMDKDDARPGRVKALEELKERIGALFPKDQQPEIERVEGFGMLFVHCDDTSGARLRSAAGVVGVHKVATRDTLAQPRRATPGPT